MWSYNKSRVEDHIQIKNRNSKIKKTNKLVKLH